MQVEMTSKFVLLFRCSSLHNHCKKAGSHWSLGGGGPGGGGGFAVVVVVEG